MTFTYILRDGGALVNELTASITSYTGTFRVRLLRGDTAIQSHSGVSLPSSVVFNLPLDADNNPIRATYRIGVTEEVWGASESYTDFTYNYIPFIPEINFVVDGFTSSLIVSDDSDYSTYAFISRELTVTPPSPLGAVTDTTSTIEYPPNIWTGDWNVSLLSKVMDDSTNVLVTDEPLLEKTYTVRPQLTEEEMYEGVRSYYHTYNEALKNAPRQALAMQPQTVLLGSLLHQYFVSWRQGDKLRAYRYLLEIYGILSPTYLGIPQGNEEVIPFDIVSVDHVHNNLSTLEFLSEVGGELYFNGNPVGGGVGSGQVQLYSGSDLKYLRDWLGFGLAQVGNDVVVDRDDIGQMAGTGLEYNSGTKEFDVTLSPTDLDKTDLVRKHTSGEYVAGEMVYRTVSGVDTFYVATATTTQQPPNTQWRLATDSELRHVRNRDVKLGNHMITANTSTISSETLDIEWEGCNAIRIVQDEEDNTELSYLTDRPSEAIDDINAPYQDITIIYIKNTSNFTINEAAALASHVRFNNKGNTIVFANSGDWARYRYNKTTERLDLVASSVIGESTSSGLSFTDFGGTVETDISNPAFVYDDAGNYTLNRNLQVYDNTDTQYVSEFEIQALVDAALTGVQHNDLGGIDEGDILHTTLVQQAEWDGKQDEITLDPDEIVSTDGSGKVATTGLSLASVMALFDVDNSRYTIRLNDAGTVGGRLTGLVEGTDYPTGWTLASDAQALVITHNLNRTCFDVKVKSQLVSGNRVTLRNDLAFSTLTDIVDGGQYNQIRLDALATVETELYIEIII